MWSKAGRGAIYGALWLLVGGLILGPGPRADVGPETPSQLVDKQKLLGFLADNNSLTLIDARSPEEFAAQHIPGAINLPFDQLDQNRALLPEDYASPIVVYCRSGQRAEALRADLASLGYSDVQVLPREQIFWNDEVMVFNCGVETPATPNASPITAVAGD